MEIKLSSRMQYVSDLVSKRNVADIGCDHAFVSIYLIQTGKADKVLAMDVKDGPVGIAKENIALYGFEDYIEVRKSNGFEAAEVGEIDCAIIAGMGGHLIVDILEKGKAFTDYGVDLILQPQSDIPFVREYLHNIGYNIVNERMLIEEGKYYSIIKAVKGITNQVLNEEQIKYGPCLLEKKDGTLLGFLKHSIAKNKEIIAKINHNKDGQNTRVKELLAENEFICFVINKYFDW